MQTQKALMELFRALIDSIAVLGRNTLLFVHNYVTHMQETSLPSNLKLSVICQSATLCTNLLILACIIKCFQQLHRKHLIQNVCACGLRKESWTENQCPASYKFQNDSLATSHAVNNCEMFLSVWLWACTVMQNPMQTAVVKETMMPSTWTGFG